VAPKAESISNENNKDAKLDENIFAVYHDAVSALLTLGYKATDADQAVRKASEEIGENASTEELIRKALGR
jgi:Holliday junction resolvasome RuvABC DNA-binding subunit